MNSALFQRGFKLVLKCNNFSILSGILIFGNVIIFLKKFNLCSKELT